ncbi:hypothetical protein D3C74_01060 [compost metagenome]
MISYGCIAIMFLFVVAKIITYYLHKRRAPSYEQIDKELLTALNSRNERYE